MLISLMRGVRMAAKERMAGRSEKEGPHLRGLVVAALGIVFGDLVTSPLYTIRECFYGANPVAAMPDNVLGVASLIIWSLLLVVSLKYLLFVLRADNHGEGGVVALLALINPWHARRHSLQWGLMLLGLFGSALLYGDGTITPAISVLSALEGLTLATPALKDWIVPLALLILFCLFLVQHRGSTSVGGLFGPVLLIWLVAIGWFGLQGIVGQPRILAAFNPWWGLRFFLRNGLDAYLVLGAIFLCLTGAEALYADLGHFGRTPIRMAWFCLALPALLLNYLGQAGIVLAAGDANAQQPFFSLVPPWAIYPMVGLSTAATVIASQAVIAGAFSLTRQLSSLGQLPFFKVVQTSADEHGQIYIPVVNWVLMCITLALVLFFGSSDALAAAYGIAVAGTMLITTILVFFVSGRLQWSPVLTALICGVFLLIDSAFLGANLTKITDGGWYPLLAAALLFAVMTTWARGRQRVLQQQDYQAEAFALLALRLKQNPPHRIPGTAAFLTSSNMAPTRLVRHLELHRVLQEHVIILTVDVTDSPRVAAEDRLTVTCIAPEIYRIVLHYGFMQQPNIPVALKLAGKLGLDIDPSDISYYVGHETLLLDRDSRSMARWRELLFIFLARNAHPATAYYGLPPKDVIELGFQIRI